MCDIFQKLFCVCKSIVSPHRQTLHDQEVGFLFCLVLYVISFCSRSGREVLATWGHPGIYSARTVEVLPREKQERGKQLRVEGVLAQEPRQEACVGGRYPYSNES